MKREIRKIVEEYQVLTKEKNEKTIEEKIVEANNKVRRKANMLTLVLVCISAIVFEIGFFLLVGLLGNGVWATIIGVLILAVGVIAIVSIPLCFNFLLDYFRRLKKDEILQYAHWLESDDKKKE